MLHLLCTLDWSEDVIQSKGWLCSGQYQGKSGTSAKSARQFNISTHQAGKLTGDMQPETCAFRLARVAGATDLLEFLEYFLMMLGIDARARVPNTNFDHIA